MKLAVRFAGIEGDGEAINQRGETVLVCDHLLMVKRRERTKHENHATGRAETCGRLGRSEVASALDVERGGQRRIEAIRVLGSDETLAWTQDGDALRVAHPKSKPSDITLGREII